jgi:alanine racemase
MDTDASRLDIDLGAIAANWRSLAARHPSGPVAGVVKADAYGLGAARVAPALHGVGCRHFFTAHLAEAQAIRPLVPGAMVAVLNGVIPGTEPAYAANGLTAVLGSRAEIDRWRGAGGGPAILHVDTGMNRLGLDPRDMDAAGGLDLLYVMTHLVSSEVADDPNNARQLAAFAAVRGRFPGVRASFANSSGIFLGAAFGSDLARPGAALYGINPVPGRSNPMRNVVTLRTRVLALREVPAGGTVGYNATWRAARPSRIATACAGYADGWPRSLSGRGHALFDGTALPLVGRVSMDLATYDATDCPTIRQGDWLELMGPGLPPDTIAEWAGTNGYEILTRLGPRYARAWV